MNPSANVTATLTRLGTDNTLTAIVPTTRMRQLRGNIRNIYTGSTGWPYIVISVKSGDAEHAQRMDGFKMQLEVHIVDKIESGIDNIVTIMERVYGDANKTASLNGVPSYGLHAHPLVFGSDANGWLGGVMDATGFDFGADDETQISASMYFSVFNSRRPA